MTPDEVTQLEQDWIGRVAVTQPDVYFDWQPAPVPLFTQLLDACLPSVPAGGTFLDAGCGIGTKCLIASGAGLAVHGIDRVPEYLTEAATLGVSAEQVLIEDYTGYGNFGLVYLNHPLVTGPGDNRQALLAATVHAAMASGSVLLSVNYDLAPGCLSHPPDRACDTSCRTDAYSGWAEITRAGPWHAAWVKS